MPWFQFRGVRTDALGVIVEQMPSFPRPRPRETLYTIAGRHGSLARTDGCYDSISAKAQINVFNAQYREYLNTWLTGHGTLILSDDPDKAYHVRVTDLGQYDRLFADDTDDYSTLTVTFTADPPFRFQAAPVTLNPASGATLTNPGTIEAEPLLRIRGNGSASLTFGGQTYEFTGLSPNYDLVIDTAAGKVYQDGGTGSPVMSGAEALPVIPTDASTISYTGLTKCELHPEWRWL